MSKFNYLFKYIVIGDSGVGKSCILLQFLENQIRTEHEVTIGVEFGAKLMNVDGQLIKFQIWDTVIEISNYNFLKAGQESYRSILRSYYRSAIGALLVYDISSQVLNQMNNQSQKTFYSLQKWLEEMKSNGNANMVIVLCGNKVDKEQSREVTYQEGEKFAKQNNLFFFETSALNGINIEDAFLSSARTVLDLIKKGFHYLCYLKPGIKIGETQNSKQDKEESKKVSSNNQNQTVNSNHCCSN